MKRISILTLSSLISVSSWSACTYNFDATQKQLSSTSDYSSFETFPNIVSQKASFTIKANFEAPPFIAVNGDHITKHNKGIEVPKSGIFAYEYKIKIPTELLNDREGLTTYPTYADAYYDEGKDVIAVNYFNHLIGSTTPNKIAFSLGVFNQENPKAIELPVTNTSDGYQKIGVYINQNTNQVGFIYNGINQGYLTNTQRKITNLAFQNSMKHGEFKSNSVHIGKTYSIELITDASKMQFTYPTGTTDICGSTI